MPLFTGKCQGSSGSDDVVDVRFAHAAAHIQQRLIRNSFQLRGDVPAADLALPGIVNRIPGVVFRRLILTASTVSWAFHMIPE